MITNADKPGFFARLKQHHIYRVIVVYAVAAWVLIQLANSIFPDFGLSHRAVRALIIALALGFPVVLVLGWTLVKPSDPGQFDHWQRLRWKLGALLSLIVVTFVIISGWYIWRVSERHAQQIATSIPAPASAVSAFNPPSDSIVVLPFVNLSGDPKQQYFSDGITEELTNALGQNQALRVIAWDTASVIRDPNQAATEIGKQLNVANLLHGSILRQGDQVRITVELVNTMTGYQLWSEHYDSSFKDIFAVQDSISNAIASALKTKLTRSGRATMQATINPEAHDLYLKGLAAWRMGSVTGFAQARKYFTQAIALDPQYADAYAGLAHAYFNLYECCNVPLTEELAQARAAANHALVLDANNVAALTTLAASDAVENHLVQSQAKYQQALALDPNNVDALLSYSNILPIRQALVPLQDAGRLDPRNWSVYFGLMYCYLYLQDYQRVIASGQTLAKLNPQKVATAFLLAFAYQQLHQNRAMLRAFDLVKPDSTGNQQLLNAGRLSYRASLDARLRGPALAALESLRQTPLHNYSEIPFLFQAYLVLGNNERAVQLMQTMCNINSCSDLAIRPMYKPLRGDPRFQQLVKQFSVDTLE